MPKSTFSGTLYLRRSRLGKLQIVIEDTIKQATHLSGATSRPASDKQISDSDHGASAYSTEHAQKLSTLLEVLQSELRDYDSVCDDVAGALELPGLEDSEEDKRSELSTYLDNSIQWARELQTLRQTPLLATSQSPPSHSVKIQSEPDAFGTQLQHLIQISQETQRQTQSLIASQTSLTQRQHTQQSQLAAQARSQSNTRHTDASKLPKLQIPKYSGDILKWFEFHDMFKASVHARDLSGVEKLSYLKSLLQGSALDAIAGLPLSDANYPVAMNALSERFGIRRHASTHTTRHYVI